MTTTTTSIFHRTVRLGAGFLIAGAVLTACGETDDQVSSGPGAASAAAPEAAYVSPEQADRAAMLALRNAMGSADALERRATVGQSSALGSADALERRGLTDHTSAHRSADALERWALSDSGS